MTTRKRIGLILLGFLAASAIIGLNRTQVMPSEPTGKASGRRRPLSQQGSSPKGDMTVTPSQGNEVKTPSESGSEKSAPTSADKGVGAKSGTGGADEEKAKGMS